MTQKAIWLVVIAAALSVPLLAQSAAPDTLSMLLAEVRQLRLALERTATTAPQIQLLGARLTVQNDRLARASADHDQARRELEDVTSESGELQRRLEEMEPSARETLKPELQRQVEEQANGMKQALAMLAAREQRLRAREAELAATLSAEQAQWFELNRRLDELERTLNAR